MISHTWESNEQNRKRDMDSWNRQTAVQSEAGGVTMEEGKEISRRTCIHNPQTQTTVWLWTEGSGGDGWMEEGKGRKMGTFVIV